MRFTASIGDALVVIVGLAFLALIGNELYHLFANILVLGDWG